MSAAAPSPLRLWPALESWHRQRLARRVISPLTARNQVIHLREFAEFVGPDTRLEDVRAVDIEGWLEHLLTGVNAHGRPFQPSSIHRKVSPVQVFFGQAARRGLIHADPCVDLVLPKLSRRRPRALAPETVRQLVQAAGSHRDRTILIVALSTGLRASELARLHVEHWDRERHRLFVVRSKSGAEDHAYLSADAEEELAAWVRFGLGGRTSGPLWPSDRTGAPLRAASIGKIVRHAADRADVVASCHSLRHTFATGLADDGAPVHVMRDALGHANTSTTNGYLWARDDDVAAAVRGLPPSWITSPSGDPSSN